MSDIIELIMSRRSVRHFAREAPSGELVERVLTAGAWAPSGLNNQPWAFAVATKTETKEAMAGLTRYGRIVREAPVLIAVFLDNAKSYDRTKDCQAVGACVQNMLLCAHEAGLGAVWLGEILKSGEEVARLLDAPDTFELMAVVAMGRPAEKPHEGKRRPLSESVFYRE